MKTLTELLVAVRRCKTEKTKRDLVRTFLPVYGDQLAAARAKAGLSLEQIAQKLFYIPLWKWETLESIQGLPYYKNSHTMNKLNQYDIDLMLQAYVSMENGEVFS